MNIQIVTLLKIAGWILTLAPLAGFLLFAIVMVREISKNDDESIKGIISIGFLVFGIGVVLLLVSYLGGYFSGTGSSI
ncbi:hypothetical protein A3C09_01875 [Candidatus Uhrbacteria bacterium RIFCSPHIGHO2_02_FULL_47_44]|uniref:Uncharacterized protein n=1 Tax=Candidatus Uhrbacteria bacterium RIFCSPLOWO2_02_FULL_48_18 TaxID=1802408 RepID=A0A1F7VC04_9BACT|nr:MAG: hypothetical protein A2839_03040 [Candidatus Uhrbacteria bacterium RIFCSPHIGHO2_01_FULL_47_10]OGL70429.1 MAG: hypothetical protein A3C09_01875 [Candidatus Uhrbacteria bacterium RIFCSPHIGHO2_02_FULL_47_44]OGL76880.1 MAG: hypothetical protein A3E97_01905 [Candidatus Uhrbacteria bacterium RIFCSPHIGHO2_12_FULL_47_12]OGL82349.1 MAG: hypothetical protein A3B20_01180 [Candidatus Uhrbacteria bacterium RIFCSPLOWO2_01_FULL_47_17]OGL87995.1 MAG: hypothetical protein A3I41_02710 [Candidatus Uhrbact